MKKLIKSKKGILPLIPIAWILGLVLIGIPVFGTWLKVITTPAKPVSPIWIAVGAFIVLVLLITRRK